MLGVFSHGLHRRANVLTTGPMYLVYSAAASQLARCNSPIYSRSTLTDSATHPATGAARQLPTQHSAQTQSFVGAISPSKAARRDAQFAGRPPLLARSGSLCQTRPAKSTLATPASAAAPARPTHCRQRISNVEHPPPGTCPLRT